MAVRRSLRALAALLAYPTGEMRAALPEILAALETEPDLAPALKGLSALAVHLGTGDLLDRQETYVELFDRSRGLCLNLFEHVHGDSRDRGPAMIELLGFYGEAGLEPASGELPDYLPMLLEYAAVQPGHGRTLLASAAPVLDLLHGRLAARGTPYVAALHAALLLAGAAPGQVPLADAPDPTPEELDAAYAEAPVVFGPGADPTADCGVDAMAARLRAARRNPNPPPPRRPVIRHLPARQGA